MMRLEEKLPDTVEYKGLFYKLTPSFDNVLKLLSIEEDNNLDSDEKLELMLHFLLGEENYPVEHGLLLEIFRVLFPSHKEGGTAKIYDFNQDAQYIYAAFKQAYGIDLFEEQGRLHWLQFIALLQGIPDDTKFAQILQIRSTPLPKPTRHNAEYRLRLLRLKNIYRLKISEEERQRDLQSGLRKMATALLKMAQQGG